MSTPKSDSLASGSGLRDYLLQGHVIPALPLALDSKRKWSQRHQRALVRYYHAAGAGGLAVGVHSTQFEIRQPEHKLFEPVLNLASAEIDGMADGRPFVKIAGICGETSQALREAEFAANAGYHAGLLSLAALKQATPEAMVTHCREVSKVIPVVGFYLQPAVGGRILPYRFWRDFAEIENVVAIKMAPFNRYQTWDVVRAVMESGRTDIALYTGNDDNIIGDLLTPWVHGGETCFIVGGLLGQWGVWTKQAVKLLESIKQARLEPTIDSAWLTRNAELTDANAVIFDAANGFAGCLPGIHEILRRQGLLPDNLCLNPAEVLSPGQSEELDRVSKAYPWLVDDDFVAAHLNDWLKD